MFDDKDVAEIISFLKTASRAKSMDYYIPKEDLYVLIYIVYNPYLYGLSEKIHSEYKQLKCKNDYYKDLDSKYNIDLAYTSEYKQLLKVLDNSQDLAKDFTRPIKRDFWIEKFNMLQILKPRYEDIIQLLEKSNFLPMFGNDFELLNKLTHPLFENKIYYNIFVSRLKIQYYMNNSLMQRYRELNACLDKQVISTNTCALEFAAYHFILKELAMTTPADKFTINSSACRADYAESLCEYTNTMVEQLWERRKNLILTGTDFCLNQVMREQPLIRINYYLMKYDKARLLYYDYYLEQAEYLENQIVDRGKITDFDIDYCHHMSLSHYYALKIQKHKTCNYFRYKNKYESCYLNYRNKSNFDMICEFMMYQTCNTLADIDSFKLKEFNKSNELEKQFLQNTIKQKGNSSGNSGKSTSRYKQVKLNSEVYNEKDKDKINYSLDLDSDSENENDFDFEYNLSTIHKENQEFLQNKYYNPKKLIENKELDLYRYRFTEKEKEKENGNNTKSKNTDKTDKTDSSGAETLMEDKFDFQDGNYEEMLIADRNNFEMEKQLEPSAIEQIQTFFKTALMPKSAIKFFLIRAFLMVQAAELIIMWRNLNFLLKSIYYYLHNMYTRRREVEISLDSNRYQIGAYSEFLRQKKAMAEEILNMNVIWTSNTIKCIILFMQTLKSLNFYFDQVVWMPLDYQRAERTKKLQSPLDEMRKYCDFTYVNNELTSYKKYFFFEFISTRNQIFTQSNNMKAFYSDFNSPFDQRRLTNKVVGLKGIFEEIYMYISLLNYSNISFNVTYSYINTITYMNWTLNLILSVIRINMLDQPSDELANNQILINRSIEEIYSTKKFMLQYEITELVLRNYSPFAINKQEVNKRYQNLTNVAIVVSAFMTLIANNDVYKDYLVRYLGGFIILFPTWRWNVAVANFSTWFVFADQNNTAGFLQKELLVYLTQYNLLSTDERDAINKEKLYLTNLSNKKVGKKEKDVQDQEEGNKKENSYRFNQSKQSKDEKEQDKSSDDISLDADNWNINENKLFKELKEKYQVLINKATKKGLKLNLTQDQEKESINIDNNYY